MKSIFIQQILSGSTFVSPAHECGGARATKNIIARPPKISGRNPSRRNGVEKRFHNSCVSRNAKQKNFLNIILIATRKFFSIKETKIFLFCSPSGERKRWAGLPPEGRQLKVTIRIFVEKSSDFNQKVPPIFRIRILGDCCLTLASLGLGRNKDFIRIF